MSGTSTIHGSSLQRVENECSEIKKTAQELDLTLKKAEAEKAAKDNQIRSLQEEMKAQVCHSSTI